MSASRPAAELVHDYVARAVAQTDNRLRSETYAPRMAVLDSSEVDPLHARLARVHVMAQPERECLQEPELIEQPRIVIVGNAGSGKSLLLLSLFRQAGDAFLRGGTDCVPFLLDLDKDTGSSLDITAALSRVSCGAWDNVRGTGQPVALFFDALDELLTHRAHPHRLINDLTEFVGGLGDAAGNVFVACRRPAWDPSWLTQCQPPFAPYSIDYVGYEEYRALLGNDTRTDDLYHECARLGIAPLLEKAFDGFFLARRFAEGEPLPETRRECIDIRIDDLLSRGYPKDDLPHAPPARLRQLARETASVSLFSGLPTFSEQELADDLTLGSEGASPGDPEINDLRALLHQPLFVRGHHGFAFTHQLYAEHLAAEALRDIPMAKAAQLLASRHSGQRICTAYRGVAASLAESRPEFAENLLSRDPLVLWCADVPHLPQVDEDALIRHVLEVVIEENRGPWHDTAPHDTRLADGLRYHRPADARRFLEPYLSDTREIARIWGTYCAAEWGGVAMLNAPLVGLALDCDQDRSVRVQAVKAIRATSDAASVRKLYGLLRDRDDEVRGFVLEAFRQIERPAPDRYVQALTGGRSDEHFISHLCTEVRAYGDGIEIRELPAAFSAATERFGEIGDLRGHLVDGLLRRAIREGFDDIPPQLFALIWGTRAQHTSAVYYGKRVHQALAASLALRVRVIDHILAYVGENGHRPWAAAAKALGEAFGDELPQIAEDRAHGADARQLAVLSQTMGICMHQANAHERFIRFRQQAPTLTANWQWAEVAPPAPPDDDADRMHMLSQIALAGNDPVRCVWRVLGVVDHFIKRDQEPKGLTLEAVRENVARLGHEVANAVREAFILCVEQVGYSRSRVDPASGKPTMTLDWLALPFWYLRQDGWAFLTGKKAEIVLCYGFYCESDDRQHIQLLTEIRQEDADLWTRCVYTLMEDSLTTSIEALTAYLTGITDRFYLPRCGERLAQCDFPRAHLRGLLDYWRAFSPDDYADVLWGAYTGLRERAGGAATPSCMQGPEEHVNAAAQTFGTWDVMRPLLMLLEVDDARAWDELAKRATAGDLPVSTGWVGLDPYEWPISPSRTSTLAKWYILVRRSEPHWARRDNRFERSLIDAMQAVGGTEGALQELREMQRKRVFEGAEWLSGEISRLEDELLSEPTGEWGPHELIRFLRDARYRVIHAEADLFDCVHDGIADVQKELTAGEGVSAYWNEAEAKRTPKSEVSCQNVLWPRVRATLDEWGVTGAEEKWICDGRADFWVERPRKSGGPLRLPIELKTARKGYGAGRLAGPLETQLWGQYMRPARCEHGLYVVLWFKTPGEYDYPAAWDTPEAMRDDLQLEADRVGQENGVVIGVVVLDVTARTRSR